MRCAQCGKPTLDMGEPEIVSLETGWDGRIDGSIAVGLKCATCGMQRREFDIEIDTHVPLEHRGSDHALEIDFDTTGGASMLAGFPVVVRCSCGRLKTNGLLALRKAS
jgi:hypothetical protein